MKSIRTFLLWRLVGGATLVLAVAGFSVYAVVTRSLEDQFDQNLDDRVLGFASILFQAGDDVSFEFSDELMPEYEPGPLPAYFELWYAGGELLERSNSLSDSDLEQPSPPSDEPAFWTAPLPDGRPGRFISQMLEIHHVYPEEGPGRPDARTVVVVVARGRETLAAAERKLLISCVAVSLALIALIAFLSWTAVERGLEPTNRLIAKLDAIEVDRLPGHFQVDELPSELQPVADTTDALIRRVDSALKRERRTTADIAHELRTPIAEVLTVSEVALRNGQDPAGARAALGTVRNVAWRMGHAVSTLLKLARIEMGTETFGRDQVDVTEVVTEVVRSLAPAARERDLSIKSSVSPGEIVEGDREVLRIVVSNLLSNAVHYSPVGTAIDCRVDHDSRWRFVVENKTVDLSADDVDALTEPFWRKDRARSDRDRSGLGLALSLALAEKAGLTLDFALDDGVFCATLSGPNGTNGQAADPTVA